MLHRKLGEGLPIQIIIVAIILLVTLVVILVFFTGRFKGISDDVNSCVNRGGVCNGAVDGSCPTGFRPISGAVCYSGKTVDSKKSCCIGEPTS